MKSKLLVLSFLCSLVFLSGKGILAQSFTKIEVGPHVTDGAESAGCAWGDFDNDGDEDLFVANGLVTSKKNSLFVNEGTGNDYSFTLFEGGYIVTDASCSRASSWGDYDNDGDLDLYVANQITSKYNYLYQNNGDNTFTRYTEGAIAYNNVDSEVAGWVDYDNDGYLDLYETNFEKPNGLYHNNGDGSFTRVLEGPLVSKGMWNYSWGDFNNDGDFDLCGDIYVDDTTAFFLNEGNGTFTKIQGGMVLNDPLDPISGDNWVDYDNDGDWDYVSAGNKIYRNEGPDYDYKFTRITSPDSIIDTWGLPQWADMDNDGDIDCFLEYNWGGNSLFSNNGDGTFTKILEGDIVEDTLATTGSAWADYDNDGDMDLYVCNCKFQGGTEVYNNNLFRNDNDNGNGWIKIKLIGTASNAAAIGAVVKVKATTGATPVWQMRAIEGQSGFLGQNSLIAHFGLGTASVIDSLIVLWPAGHDTVLTDVTVNQLLTITEKMPECYLRAEFEVDTTLGMDKLSVQFTDKSLFDPSNPITSWSWDFNSDGTEDSDEQNPIYNFTNAEGEVFDISLVISNGTDTDTIHRSGLIKVIPLGGNLALFGKATASSEKEIIFNPQMAIDGQTYSYWSSIQNDDQWMKVELDSAYTIGKVVIQWERGYGSQYSLQTSINDANWNTVYMECFGDGANDTILFTGVEAKYLKLQGIDRGNFFGYTIYEFEIYPSDGNTYEETIDECGVGIKGNLIRQPGVRVYPNPANDVINIEIEYLNNAIIEIYSISGNLIFSKDLNSKVEKIDVSGFPNGIYFVKVIQDKAVNSGKMVIR